MKKFKSYSKLSFQLHEEQCQILQSENQILEGNQYRATVLIYPPRLIGYLQPSSKLKGQHFHWKQLRLSGLLPKLITLKEIDGAIFESLHTVQYK